MHLKIFSNIRIMSFYAVGGGPERETRLSTRDVSLPAGAHRVAISDGTLLPCHANVIRLE